MRRRTIVRCIFGLLACSAFRFAAPGNPDQPTQVLTAAAHEPYRVAGNWRNDSHGRTVLPHGTGLPEYRRETAMRESRSDPHPARNLGVFEHSRHATDLGKFCAPSLRNVAATVPYVHDGSIATALALTPQNKADLAAFLESLTDTAVSTDRDFPTPLARDSTSFDNQLVP